MHQRTCVVACTVTLLAAASARAVVIDTFETDQTITATGNNIESDQALGPGILGTGRDTGAAFNASVVVSSGVAEFNGDTSSSAMAFCWDGPKESFPLNPWTTGLGNADLTGNGLLNALSITVLRTNAPVPMFVHLFENQTVDDYATFTLPGNIDSPVALTVPFASLIANNDNGIHADYSKINAIILGTNFEVPIAPGTSFQLGVFETVFVPEPGSSALLAVGAATMLFATGWRHAARSRRAAGFPLRATFVWLLLACLTTRAAAVTIETVPIGNPGNPGELSGAGAGGSGRTAIVGGVAYNYRIGTYEVTVGQYTDFLNAVAATDTWGLYNPLMATDPDSAGIARSGASGSYTYSVMNSPNHPVTYVSWGDSARFANWLHNGQPTGVEGPGTTETGAYTLDGVVTSSVPRNSDAKWFIPTESEWYKAAYHKNDGVTSNYWDYPVSTDSVPYSDQPPGVTPDNTRVANFRKDDGFPNGYDDGYAVTGSPTQSPTQNYLTNVGAYTLSPGPYDTFDQGGNVDEWTETFISGFPNLRGGSWIDNRIQLLASNRVNFVVPTGESSRIGFRVATIPEPSTLVLAAVAMVGALAWRWRRRWHRRSAAHHFPLPGRCRYADVQGCRDRGLPRAVPEEIATAAC